MIFYPNFWDSTINLIKLGFLLKELVETFDWDLLIQGIY
uniref:Uncharacterized protein n=1 Tax=Tetranychus urticae TaxID=32264 RepID=T1KLB4_TETUR